MWPLAPGIFHFLLPVSERIYIGVHVRSPFFFRAKQRSVSAVRTPHVLFILSRWAFGLLPPFFLLATMNAAVNIRVQGSVCTHTPISLG